MRLNGLRDCPLQINHFFLTSDVGFDTPGVAATEEDMFVLVDMWATLVEEEWCASYA